MIATLPDNVRELILDCESDSMTTLVALGIVEDFPFLAEDDRIRDMVSRQLETNALGYRFMASRILCRLGDPRGILHLTYNSLSQHPKLGCDHTRVSGWSDGWAIRWAHLLNEECLTLLIDDICSGRSYLHADLLASAPKELAVPRLLGLLNSDRLVSAQAAYALAWHGRKEGRDILQSIIDECDVPLFELALVALSHITDSGVLALLESLANLQHAVFRKLETEDSKKKLASKAAQRLMVLQDQSENVFIGAMEHFYTNMERDYKDTQKEFIVKKGFSLPEAYEPKLFLLQQHSVTWTADFIFEFSNESARKKLSTIQTTRLVELCRHISDDRCFDISNALFFAWSEHPKDSRCLRHSDLPGVKVHNEQEDFIFAATDWLLHPEKYRIGAIGHLRYTFGRP
jgi:hypothetical protein